MKKMELFDFAYFSQFDVAISDLARMAMPEQWYFSGEDETSYTILKDYLEHIFRRVKFEQKVEYSSDNRLSCFNTGLMTPSYRYIFAFFEKNRNPDARNPYYFKKFLSESDIGYFSHFDRVPQAPFFFSDPSLLIYNPALEIVIDIDHIVDDNINRFPDEFRGNKDLCRRLLEGAIPETKKRLQANYKIAVPHCYDNKVQLLLPIYLSAKADTPNPDMALAVEKNRDKYYAITCLTMRMAYQDARIIVRPESSWLRP